MPPIPSHHTDTTDVSWDASANVRRIPNDASESTLRAEFAWVDPELDPETKQAYKFPHHMVSEAGNVGAANVKGCQSGIAVLNGAMGGANIPDADRRGVYKHLAMHLRDAGVEPADLKESNTSFTYMRDVKYEILSLLASSAWAIDPRYIKILSNANMLSLLATSPSKQNKENLSKEIAILDISGVITPKSSVFSDLLGGTSLTDFASKLRQAANDKKVSTILLNVDSPGGMVDFMPETAALIRNARKQKPVVAIANPTAASAAYWLASQADKFYVTPSGEVGSIGVYTAHTDISKWEELQGYKTTLVSAGKYKLEGNPFGALDDEAALRMQEVVDHYYDMFISDVAAGRGVAKEAVMSGYGQGRLLTAKEAQAENMVDGISTFDNVIDSLAVSSGSVPSSFSSALKEKARYEYLRYVKTNLRL